MTKPKTTFVTNEQLYQAEKNWHEAHFGLRCEEVMERFFSYLHSLEQSAEEDMLCHENGAEKYHVSASTAKRIKQLAGPHFHTMVKAYYVNHPWKPYA